MDAAGKYAIFYSLIKPKKEGYLAGGNSGEGDAQTPSVPAERYLLLVKVDVAADGVAYRVFSC